MRKGDSRAEKVQLPSIGTDKTFSVENSVRMFFTVIAYDPVSTRAGQFLTLFRHLIPHFCESGPGVQSLLRDGVEAFASIFSKASATKPKLPSSLDTDIAIDFTEKGMAEDNVGKQQQQSSESTWSARQESFLLLVEAFFKTGQGLRTPAMRKILDIVRITLKDGGESSVAASFVKRYTESAIGSQASPTPKQVLAFLREIGPLFRAHIGSVDFSPLLDEVCRLQSDPRFAFDEGSRSLVVGSFVTQAVEACAAFAAKGAATQLSIRSATVRLVASLATRGDRQTVEVICGQKPSAGFLATFVLPVCLELDTNNLAFPQTATAQAAWLRLLEYVVDAGERAVSTPTLANGPVAVLAIQIIKVILIRGERELDVTKGAWLFVAHALRRMLADGGSAFLAQSFRPGFDADGSSTLHVRPTTTDFALWSFSEFLVLYRTPIMLHLRMFVREKLVQVREWSSSSQDRNERSNLKSETTTPFSDRRRASMFLKSPPVRTSSRKNVASGAASPRRSRSPSPSPVPVIVGRPQTPATPRRSMVSLSPSEDQRSASSRRPSFSSFKENYIVLGPPRTPSPASSPTRAAFPRIQHLGLTSDIAGNNGVSQVTFVTSPTLVRSTVRRIEVVQLVMGEKPISHPLLYTSADRDSPLNMGSEAGDESWLKSWTQSDALRKTVAETNVFMDEFSGLFSEG
jgi:hypothetical protein